ncbi:MAG: peptidoglycan-associated lipoprotein Pal [Gammaproteobacteria bacterium]|nr:peptidoglycan-associated lipoprotein Pal [Gammaproteobacteria bacterium]
MRRTLPLLLVAAAIALTGCPRKPMTLPPPEPAPAPAATTTTGGVSDASVGAARELPPAAPPTVAAAGPVGATLVIYFDYDSSDIRPEFAAAVSAHAHHLAANPALRLRLEGHTDERGAREYNIALGERRAQAVRRALLLQGAADGQIATVSYGEERPAVDGSDESAWARNRRVEIAYSR